MTVAGDGRPKKKRRATLTPWEDHCWVFYFCYYLDEGKSDDEADQLTWRDMLSEFPRLRFYDGCEP
jgi:hypothetical protein